MCDQVEWSKMEVSDWSNFSTSYEKIERPAIVQLRRSLALCHHMPPTHRLPSLDLTVIFLLIIFAVSPRQCSREITVLFFWMEVHSRTDTFPAGAAQFLAILLRILQAEHTPNGRVQPGLNTYFELLDFTLI